MTKRFILIAIIIAIFIAGNYIAYGGVVGSKHDISDGTISPCMYCHTPHNARTGAGAPLWNIVERNTTYQMYSSDTMNVPVPNQPSGVSLVCLSCHDGADTIGTEHPIMTVNKPEYMNDSNCSKCHPGTRQAPGRILSSDILINSIGTDLRNDHPISIPYPTPSQDPDFYIPPDSQKGWSDVRLFNGKVECSSCHNPHDPTHPPFLSRSNEGSGLCLTCHRK